MDAVAFAPIHRRKKEDIADEIADALRIDRPKVSEGSSVDATFLRRIYLQLSRHVATGTSAYDVVGEICSRLGLDADPWDTSAGTESTGGSTVTARAYSRILCAIVGTPRCFVMPVPRGTLRRWCGGDGSPSITFSSMAGAGMALLDAGPGSRIALVEPAEPDTGRDPAHILVGHAKVNHISSRYRVPPWTVTLCDVETVEPIPVAVTLRAGAPGALAAIEVEPAQLDVALAAATKDFPASVRMRNFQGEGPTGVRPAAARHGAPAGDTWPSWSAEGALEAGPSTEPDYVDDSHGVVPDNPEASLVAGGQHDRELDRRTEQTAVALAIRYMTARGWELVQDMQSNGVGFDLWFMKEADEAKVEVKGIRSRSLAFNLTPKEWWRCRTDPRFVVLAVTGALTADPYVHVVTRERILRGERVAIGFRVVPAHS